MGDCGIMVATCAGILGGGTVGEGVSDTTLSCSTGSRSAGDGEVYVTLISLAGF